MPGRLPPERVFPAGRPDYRVRWLELPAGERVRAVEYGPADGPLVVLVHGWGCSAYDWRENLPALGAAGWRAVAVELRGHGQSSKPRDAGAYTQEAMTRHLLDVLDALGAARVPLVGHSLGGLLVVQAALRAPERVSRLVLAGPVGFGPAALARFGRAVTPRVVTPLVPRLVSRAAVWVALRVATGSLGRTTREDVEQYYAPSRDRGYAIAARHLLHGCRWLPHRLEDLAGLHVPSLVVFGARDRLVGWRGAERYVRAMPDARLEILPGAGHIVPAEAAEKFNRLVVGFLGEEPRAASREP